MPRARPRARAWRACVAWLPTCVALTRSLFSRVLRSGGGNGDALAERASGAPSPAVAAAGPAPVTAPTIDGAWALNGAVTATPATGFDGNADAEPALGDPRGAERGGRERFVRCFDGDGVDGARSISSGARRGVVSEHSVCTPSD